MLSKVAVFILRGFGEPVEIPTAWVRAADHDQVHTLAGAKPQVLDRAEHSIIVLGFHDSHDHDPPMSRYQRDPFCDPATVIAQWP
ncbi:MAG: hypothetical protein K2X03_27990 [Bryobacteraceae bacterium]|nr:hypothetical protein [Bryobacteraceae bacterium]